jgi:Leucine-rich repeat (LRR) protein
MTQENIPGSEYVNVSANNISSWWTSSRGIILPRGADIDQCKISDIPSRNSETNNFQNRRANFETKVNLSKKEGIEVVPPHTKSV